MKEKADLCDCNIVHEDAVKLARDAMLGSEELEGVAYLFKLLSDPTRMRIMWALDSPELCTCDIAATLGMTKSAVSHQLNTLKQAKMVKSRREGKNVFYSHDDAHVKDIVEIAREHVKHGRDRTR